MTHKTLPSGAKVFDPLASVEVENVVESSGDLESTAAMSHEADNICPKCNASMTRAKADVLEVWYCTSCRVSNPIKE